MFKVIPITSASRVCYKLLSCNKLHRSDVLSQIDEGAHHAETRTAENKFLQQTHYDVLELPQSCSSKQIREAFIRLSKKSHPDVNKNDPRSKEHFVRVNEAYSVLIKPSSRLEYDISLKQQSTHPRHAYTSAQYTHSSYKSAWQEPSFYKNRNFSKDRHHQEKPYYGVKGIKRMSNTMFVLLLIGFTAVGVGLQVLAILNSHTMSRADMIRRSQEYNDCYAEIRERAAQNGSREHQIEEFQRRVNE